MDKGIKKKKTEREKEGSGDGRFFFIRARDLKSQNIGCHIFFNTAREERKRKKPKTKKQTSRSFVKLRKLY